jgi:hypothetical protein
VAAQVSNGELMLPPGCLVRLAAPGLKLTDVTFSCVGDKAPVATTTTGASLTDKVGRGPWKRLAL